MTPQSKKTKITKIKVIKEWTQDTITTDEFFEMLGWPSLVAAMNDPLPSDEKTND